MWVFNLQNNYFSGKLGKIVYVTYFLLTYKINYFSRQVKKIIFYNKSRKSDLENKRYF